MNVKGNGKLEMNVRATEVSKITVEHLPGLLEELNEDVSVEVIPDPERGLTVAIRAENGTLVSICFKNASMTISGEHIPKQFRKKVRIWNAQ